MSVTAGEEFLFTGWLQSGIVLGDTNYVVILDSSRFITLCFKYFPETERGDGFTILSELDDATIGVNRFVVFTCDDRLLCFRTKKNYLFFLTDLYTHVKILLKFF